MEDTRGMLQKEGVLKRVVLQSKKGGFAIRIAHPNFARIRSGIARKNTQANSITVMAFGGS